MKDLLNTSPREKHLFRSSYCLACNQIKTCGKLNLEYCCPCFYQMEQEKAQAHNSYEEVLATEYIEREKKFRQLQLLRSYSGCPQCRSKEVDAYRLYEENRLVCWVCLVKKESGSSSPISFSEQKKWFRKNWRISLSEWLEIYQRLPVNKNCVEKWRLDKGHLESCDCLEVEAKETYLLFANSLREKQEKLKECECIRNDKVRVKSDNYAWCEICDKVIGVASKKRVIRNRNDPRFWGIGSVYKILCLECIGKEFYKEMEEWQRKKYCEYVRRGYF